MISLPEPLPLPVPDDYEAHVKSVEIKHFSSSLKLDEALASIGNSSTDFKFFSRKAGHLFEVADSIDQSSEDLIDESRPESQAMYLGSVAGLLIALEAGGPAMLPAKVLDVVKFQRGDEEGEASDELAHRYGRAQAIRDFGAKAYYDLNNPTRARIEAWSDKAVVDVRHRQLFTSGLGVAIAAGYHFQESYTKFYYRRQLEDLAQSFHDVDIDASLSRLLEGN